MRLCVFHVMIGLALMFTLRPHACGGQAGAEEAAPAFQWLDGHGETSGVKFTTLKLRPLSLQTSSGAPVSVEEEKVQVDARTLRITRRVYNATVSGGRELTETVVEEIRNLPGDRVEATRTISRKDANGRFSAVQKETQEARPIGQDVFQIRKSVLQPGANNALVEKEQIQQTERRKGESLVEIDRTRYVPDMNGKWRTAERRISQNALGKERTQSEEQVYTNDVNNRLSLAQQVRVTEWTDASGQKRRQSEVHEPDIEGRFQLGSRTTMVQKPLKDGRQETTETLERPSPTAPGAGLRTVRKIVENLRVVGPDQTERQLDVLEPDVNGRWRPLESWQDIEVR